MNIRNGVPLINGVEYSWGDIVAAANGVPFEGTHHSHSLDHPLQE